MQRFRAAATTMEAVIAPLYSQRRKKP